ncbi:MAG TPA: glycosyltransferase [Bryobacteraceae bacterium]|nr:glycosyltransferase [Bryobacteraceae bacterium]
MKPPQLRIVILGLSVTSSWGNGHATTYRGLMRELAARGHDVLFLERDMPWYASHRDLPHPPYGRTRLYNSIEELKDSFGRDIREADFVMVGSYVPDGIAVGEWVTTAARGIKAFYDIDTPVTVTNLERRTATYITPELIPRYDLYLSFTGGPVLSCIAGRFGAPRAEVLYCSTDPEQYYPEESEPAWDLAYLGTYSDDRHPAMERLLLEPARCWPEGRFMVAGPLYPDTIRWPANVKLVEHLAPPEHRAFYNSLRFTLNLTRADMVRAGYSPSVRLFEAAACGTPIISDYWDGLDSILRIGSEVLVARNQNDTLRYLRELPEEERVAMGARARRRVLAAHTAAHRAAQLEGYICDLLDNERSTTWPACVEPPIGTRRG